MKQLKEFIKLESSSGILLMIATVLALIFSNSPAKPYYLDFLDIELIVAFGKLKIHKPLLLWINDGLMAIFFLLVGLELKREVISGHLASKENFLLPVIGAVGGLACPALVFYFFNHDNPQALDGWAIPTATDIAFALGVLALLSDRVPRSAKIFLLTLAIFDDLAAIIIIALFYTGNISWTALLLSIIAILILTCLNRSQVKSLVPYLLVGFALWFCVLKSGVHATLAGVITALFIPIDKQNESKSPLHNLEHDLHPWVAFMILPLFAFANAGLQFTSEMSQQIFHPVTMGTGLGLIAGKQIGVFVFCYIAIKWFKVSAPQKVSIPALYGLAILTGVGFTMSLFISALAYGQSSHDYMIASRLGIIIGSLVSAVFGYIVIRMVYPAPKVSGG